MEPGELLGRVDMFYFLIRVKEAQVYPFVKTQTIGIKRLLLTLNFVKFIQKLNFSLCPNCSLPSQQRRPTRLPGCRDAAPLQDKLGAHDEVVLVPDLCTDANRGELTEASSQDSAPGRGVFPELLSRVSSAVRRAHGPPWDGF